MDGQWTRVMLCRELLGEIFMTRDKTEGAFRLVSVSPSSSPLPFPPLFPLTDCEAGVPRIYVGRVCEPFADLTEAEVCVCVCVCCMGGFTLSMDCNV